MARWICNPCRRATCTMATPRHWSGAGCALYVLSMLWRSVSAHFTTTYAIHAAEDVFNGDPMLVQCALLSMLL